MDHRQEEGLQSTQTIINAVIENSEKPFHSYNKYCSEKELAVHVGDVGDVIRTDANVDIDFGTQQPAGRQGAYKQGSSQQVQTSVSPC